MVKYLSFSNRWYDEQVPTDRRPPHDDYYRDRPPYPEDRPMHDPANYPPHPEEAGHQSEPPRFEKKAEVVPVESILDSPGRESRPDRVNMPTVSFIIVSATSSICLHVLLYFCCCCCIVSLYGI